MLATAYMPSGNTMLHSSGRYSSRAWRSACRQIPNTTSSGSRNVPKAHSTTASPTMIGRASPIAAAGGMSRMCAAATTVIAVAPIITQYDGVRSRGRTSISSSRVSTSVEMMRYSTTPVDHSSTATSPSGPVWPENAVPAAASVTTSDCVPTTQMNQLPLTPASTGPERGPRTSRAGMP